MSEALITLQGVKKSYGKHRVLLGVDMQINRGDIYGLIGKNGCGKTTIFKVILGLSDFQEGRVTIGGEGTSLSDGRRKIGFFIGGSFFDYMSARENLEYYRRLKNIKDTGEVERVLKIVEMDKAKGSYGDYSMGMKQRLGIANAILGSPEILILDEPVNGLDPQGIVDVRNLIQRLNTEYGMTIIVSSHILSELQHTAHRFGIVNNGVIAKVVTQEELAASNQIVKISVRDLPAAVKALGNAGVEILGQSDDTASLEDYYFDVIKGEQ